MNYYPSHEADRRRLRDGGEGATKANVSKADGRGTAGTLIRSTRTHNKRPVSVHWTQAAPGAAGRSTARIWRARTATEGGMGNATTWARVRTMIRNVVVCGAKTSMPARTTAWTPGGNGSGGGGGGGGGAVAAAVAAAVAVAAAAESMGVWWTRRPTRVVIP